MASLFSQYKSQLPSFSIIDIIIKSPLALSSQLKYLNYIGIFSSYEKGGIFCSNCHFALIIHEQLHYRNAPKIGHRETFNLIIFSLTAETKVFPFSCGARSKDMTSPVWPWKLCNLEPDSTSHNAHVLSPLPLKIYSRDSQQKYTPCKHFWTESQSEWIRFFQVYTMSQKIPTW